MSEFRLSTMVISPEGDRLYTFEYAALVTQTSTIVIEQYVQVGLIEPIGSRNCANCSNSEVTPGFRTKSRWSGNGLRYGTRNRPTTGKAKSLTVKFRRVC